jgi:hypothetical protein
MRSRSAAAISPPELSVGMSTASSGPGSAGEVAVAVGVTLAAADGV